MKFSGSFQVIYQVGKQTYTLKLPTRQRIHDVFYILPLKQNITRREYVNELVELEPELHPGKNKEYEIETLKDYIVITSKTARDQLPGLFYLIFWKDYLEAKDT